MFITRAIRIQSSRDRSSLMVLMFPLSLFIIIILRHDRRPWVHLLFAMLTMNECDTLITAMPHMSTAPRPAFFCAVHPLCYIRLGDWCVVAMTQYQYAPYSVQRWFWTCFIRCSGHSVVCVEFCVGVDLMLTRTPCAAQRILRSVLYQQIEISPRIRISNG